MTQTETFHFVRDYEAQVAQLIKEHPFDRAMELAVGGNYELVGSIEADILDYAGLQDRRAVFDLGCGSGRLAWALSQRFQIEYLGTDVVQSLLNYASGKAPRNYRFVLHRELTIPAPDRSIDVACAFSVFTHLLHAETYLYLEEMCRVLKPDGRIVFSFLEFATPHHWGVFEQTIAMKRAKHASHLNCFIERNAIETWGHHLGLRVVFIDADAPRWSGRPLGQSIAILAQADRYLPPPI